MGIEYFTLSDSNSRHFFRTGIGGIEIFLVIFKQPYFSADSVVVTFLIALIFGGDRTLGKTDVYKRQASDNSLKSSANNLKEGR